MKEIPHLTWIDYLVFGLLLFFSSAIGVYYGCTGGKQKTTGEFLMANRQMHVLPVTLSLLASFMSAITLLGAPAEIYTYGTQYWMIWVGYVLMIPLAAHLFIPIFFKLQITSVFEYHELRFSRGLRHCASVASIVQTILYMAIVLYAPALALNAVTGFNVWVTVFSVGIVCIFYTTLGGMKAVMWTDSFQIILMFAGLCAVIIQGAIDQNGFGQIWQIMKDGKRVEFFNFDVNPLTRHTTWGLMIGGCFTWLPIFGVNQAIVQRALTVPKLRQAQTAMWLNMVGLIALLTVCTLCGCVVYAEYKDCDPITEGRIKGSDQLLPLYVMDRLSHVKGIPGLFTACLFSGALSTLSSGLNALSAITLQDFVRAVCFKDMSEARATLVAKVLAVIYGGLCLVLTLLASKMGSVLPAALALFGMIGGPQLGIYFLGICFPCANTKGAYAGFFTGLVFSFWLGIGAQIYKPNNPKAPTSIDGCDYYNETMGFDAIDVTERAGYISFYGISYIWYGALAVLVTVVTGLVVSFITGRSKSHEVDPRLICPIFDVFYCWLPKSTRRKLHCGVDHTQVSDEEPETHTNKGMSIQPIKAAHKIKCETNTGYANEAIGAADDMREVKAADKARQLETLDITKL